MALKGTDLESYIIEYTLVLEEKKQVYREEKRLPPRLAARTPSLSSDFGSYKTVKASFWPWLSGKSP